MIAADLLIRLPVGLEVVGMVTIGSPLANGSFDVDRMRASLKEPPTNLAWWVNFWNAPDLVAAHRGVSSVFPWMIDFRIDTKGVGKVAHSATEYLGNEDVSAAIGFALFGSRSTEVTVPDKGLDVPLDTAETLTFMALRYAHLARMRLDGDLKDRFSGALRQVQASAIHDIRQRNAREGRAMPEAIARLAFDLSDPRASLPEPTAVRHLSKEDAVVPLTILASENVIRPFEIAIDKDTFRAAMQDLTAEMGLGAQYGTDVFTAAKRAQDALTSGVVGIKTLVKWGALGVGAAALAIATGGLVLAAGAGLAGAAAITSALAAFGPGGMIGGLLTAGTLVTAGGGGIAYSLASPGTTAETLEAVVSRRLAAEILRKSQGLEADPSTWAVLVETEIEVRREYERLDEFSDPTAVGLKEIKRKIDAIERALKYLMDNGLEPGRGREAAGNTDWV